MSSSQSVLLSDLKEQLGDNLRAVAEYQEDEYTFLYLREDLDEQYSTEELDDIFDDVILETLRAEYMEQQFHGGKYQCSALGFEEMMVFQFVHEDFEGLLVSFDRDCSIDLNRFFEVCKEHTGSLIREPDISY